ncbi:ABC transporter ATP-binding protein [Tuwongella immobilis]|uniref:ABC transporter domain-containing protein n=1 Tax=Tuwongella immobilis TaxID=692036 RepID=A0A6C2YQY1_9BACT|nr:ATP-binding cassette domain-containing protein [Tuwongella immobilis]VIP03814.1 mfs transporter : ABC-type multidrug transport system, ATPase component OS=Singulisphaera acidiphila (strain ATCC BAA-1392 / DSM 18658 / VKM B-2454 / MOB10) GN=Sinac_5947 PE=4 SV=1: ABC_tran [Tuwongella immobilis]VTS04995.1 mfs transporter : ABC-type multidrug transport system, ATPase component OS=Singulisphaera acidiphila (strain ATCC BAA-1392 / DSM 18658 / VKM B-2454 / MOB10) GN=Sinac_5947 PE=4 SV=1: ABC_tran [Tu
MPSNAIEVIDLCKSYGPVMAVDHVNFTVSTGEIVGFLGPNGAGKSTTMRILTTYLPASSGVARLVGYDVMTESMQVRENIGYLPESVPLYNEMRVEEYLTYRARLKGVDRRIRTQRIHGAMEKCRVWEVRRRLISTLSKGYRQRVGLADALIHDPAILIMDEPTSGLDPLQIRETLSTIKGLGGQHTVLLSTHILSEVEAVSDRVMIINRGKLELDLRMSDLLNRQAAVVLEVRGPSDAIRSWLMKQAGVTEAIGNTLADGTNEWVVKSDSKDDIREALAAGIAAQGWGLRRIDLKRQRLEDLFTGIVTRRPGYERLTQSPTVSAT